MARSRWRRALVAALSIASSLTVVAPARAQSAAATALFDKGLAALKAKDYEEACPLLEESHRLDPKPGVLFTLAACEAKRGRLATSLARYDDYLEIVSALPAAQRSRQAARERVAKKERETLSASVPMLTVVMPEKAPADLVVKRNGEVMGKPSLGIALPVDPGEQVVTVHSGDKLVLTEKVTLSPKQQRTVQLPESYPALAEPPPPPPPKPPETEVPIAIPIAALAVGGVGLGIGTLFGFLAIDKKGVVDEYCTGSRCTSDDGPSAADDGRTFATVSTVGFIVGALGVGAGITLLVVRNDGLSRLGGNTGPTMRVNVGPAAVGLTGAF